MRTKKALFEAWRGRYADNPRAISECLATRYPDVRQIWVGPDDLSLPAGIERVERHSIQYFYHLSTTDFLVSNDIVSQHHLKSPRCTYLQTWHGTPLKAIGHDETDQKYDGAEAHFKRMTRDVAKWDHLLSPSTEVTAILAGAFRFTGSILETGYPRNDVLKRPDSESLRQRVRRSLGIDEGTRTVLYAPTWRDYANSGAGFTDPGGLQVDRFVAACPDTVLLNRMHSVVTSRIADNDAVIDVSDHGDIAELYLAADVLVSDYSSTVFDFAVTGKPIVLFAYDLDHYRSDLRPFYFDYESWAPGPIVDSTDALVEAVLAATPSSTGDIDTSTRYRDFVTRFCPHEDGHASERVVDAVFAPVLG